MSCLAIAAFALPALCALGQAAPEVPLYGVYELAFDGPQGVPFPARDITLVCTWVGPAGQRLRIFGFWDGGATWRCRFCPTAVGRWRLERVEANDAKLRGQHEGLVLRCSPSALHGFWVAHGRWWRRSDGTYQYFVGNTHYTFLTNPPEQIVRDLEANRPYFGKVRFSVCGDRYEDPNLKAFLKPNGEQTNEAQYSYSPNPRYFQERVDVAVRKGFALDLICDLILSGPDKHRRQIENEAYLRYVAARYGSFPNVWFCLANEWDEVYRAEQIKAFGETLRRYLPYPTPVSVHSTSRELWNPALNGDWCDHATIQKKLKDLSDSANYIARAFAAFPGHPVINDENSYQGRGDGHSEADTIEAIFGSFMGGGYATTGEKPKNKQGQYFHGHFDPKQHSAADNLKFLVDYINANITFWQLAPGDPEAIFRIAPGFRVLSNPGHEYVVGCDAPAEMSVNLPAGAWRVTKVNLFAKTAEVIAKAARGRFAFAADDVRAEMFHFLNAENPPAR